MSNINIEYKIRGYQEAQEQMRTLLKNKEQLVKSDGEMKLTVKGSEEILKDLQDILNYQNELKKQLKGMGQNTAGYDQLEKKVNNINTVIQKLTRTINSYGTDSDKALAKQIKNFEKLEKQNISISRKESLKKQQQAEIDAAEKTLDVWQDCYRKLQKAENDIVNGKRMTSSEYSFIKKQFELVNDELNDAAKNIDKFKGKFKGASDASKQFASHMESAMQFTKDNTIETNARDNLTVLQKQWDSLQTKKDKYTRSLGKDSDVVKEISAQQERLNVLMSEQETKLREALQLERNRGNIDDKGVTAVLNRIEYVRQQAQEERNITNSLENQKLAYAALKADLQSIWDIENRITQLSKDPKKHTAELSYYQNLLNSKRQELDYNNRINQLSSKQKEEIENAAKAQKEHNNLIKAQSKDWENNNKKVTELGDTIKKVFNYIIVYRGFQMLQQGIQQAIDTMKELDKAFTDIQMVTGDTDEQTAELAQNYNSLAKEMGSTTKEVAEGASEWFNESRDHLKTLELLETRKD